MTATAGVLVIVGLASIAFVLGEWSFTPEQLLVVRPVLTIATIVGLVTWLLASRPGVNLFGEIGIIYLAIAFAYAIVPAVRFLILNVRIPLGYDGLNFAVLSPTPEEIGIHYWRHVVFFAGAAVGFLAIRLLPLKVRTMPGSGARSPTYRIRYTVLILTVVVICCAVLETLLAAPVSTYLEHYTRFDHLPWALRRLSTISIVIRSGAYFVLLGLMFSDYRTYRRMIFVLAPLICAYEIWYSMGSRIMGATILLAVFAFYNLRVKEVRVLKGAVAMGLLAVTFSAVGLVRAFGNDVGEARRSLFQDMASRGDEFDAVFATSFHIYHEREQGTLPTREWPMFFNEVIALIPLVDHKIYNPQYWYARHYFPEAPVPPTTMGVIAESGLWGGEVDLFVRSMINGVLFALLTRWFLRRQHTWWALTVYVYCYANCVMTLKYSVFYFAAPLLRVVLPAVLATSFLLWWENGRPRVGPHGRRRRQVPVARGAVGILSRPTALAGLPNRSVPHDDE